jgi:hypothetical protein
MSARPARVALGHVATAAVVGVAGGAGVLGSWWIPVGIAALLAGALAAARWWRAPPAELSLLAAVLDRGTWRSAGSATTEV